MYSFIMALSTCKVCSKLIKSRRDIIHCSVCGNSIHLRCTALTRNDSCSFYYCTFCTDDIFPFNHVKDDDEFIKTLLYFFQDFPIFDRLLLNDKHFSILNDITLTNNKDIDPDFNVFNALDVGCKYYLPHELNSELRQQSNRLAFVNEISVLHLNARSLENKISQLEVLLKSFSFEFDVISVVETWESMLLKFLNHELVVSKGVE